MASWRLGMIQKQTLALRTRMMECTPASSCPTDRYAWSSSDAFCESGTRQVSTRNHRSSVERLWPEDWTTGLGCLTKFELEQSRKGWKPAENTSSSAVLCGDLQLAQASEALRVRPQMAKAHVYGHTTAFLLFQRQKLHIVSYNSFLTHSIYADMKFQP